MSSKKQKSLETAIRLCKDEDYARRKRWAKKNLHRRAHWRVGKLSEPEAASASVAQAEFQLATGDEPEVQIETLRRVRQNDNIHLHADFRQGESWRAWLADNITNCEACGYEGVNVLRYYGRFRVQCARVMTHTLAGKSRKRVDELSPCGWELWI